MTIRLDNLAAAYFAIIGLLESSFISADTRQHVEILRNKLEEEMASKPEKSDKAAAS